MLFRGYLRRFDILKADHDFGDLAGQIVADDVGDEFLFKAAEVVVSGVFQKLLSVVVIADCEVVATKHVEEIGEDFWRAVGDARGMNGWRTEQTPGIEAREDVAGRAEEEGEAEGEVVGGVTWRGEDISWDAKVLATDFNEDFGFEKLGLESRY